MGEQPSPAEGDDETPVPEVKELSSWIGPNGDNAWDDLLDDTGDLKPWDGDFSHKSKTLQAVFGDTDSDFAEILRWEKAVETGEYRGISARQLKHAYDAVCYANYRGIIFNAEVTIAWSKLGFRKALTIEDCVKKVLERFRKWAQFRNFPGVYVCIMEYRPKIGLHTHLALFVPYMYRMEFREWLRATLRSFQAPGIPWDATTEKTDIHDRTKHSIYQQWKWFSYLIKGLDPSATVACGRGLDRKVYRLRDQIGGLNDEKHGTVYISRVRVSEAITEAAQKKVGFRPHINILSPINPDWMNAHDYDRGVKDGMQFIDGRLAEAPPNSDSETPAPQSISTLRF